ncbi:MAG: cytochrome b5 domain-containing protein [Velocimicrobium sp.]
MIHELGGFLGWLIVWTYVGTMLNYVTKAVNKKWGKKISSTPFGKKIMGFCMKVFVRNHKYFGLSTVIFLLLHFTIQFISFGFNLSGGLAASLLMIQVILGIYASLTHKKRKGAWFILHRIIAILLVFGICFHVLLPELIRNQNTTPNTVSDSLKVFTLDELATYNGQNGEPAYVAYQGIVYDVSNQPNWKNGTHNGELAGTDLTNEISKSPHGDKVFKSLPMIGTLQ